MYVDHILNVRSFQRFHALLLI